MAVDYLEDISKLEEYVSASAAMLLLLSKDYLRSRNCLREVVTTLDKSIPYLFVHEADESKGGAPLAALQLSCRTRRCASSSSTAGASRSGTACCTSR